MDSEIIKLDKELAALEKQKKEEDKKKKIVKPVPTEDLDSEMAKID